MFAFVFLALCMLVVFGGLAFVALLMKSWRAMLIFGTLAILPEIFWIGACVWSGIFPGEYLQINHQPDLAALAGAYGIAPESAQQYHGGGAKVILKEDMTFEVDAMPHAWLSGHSNSGYDDCTGTWSVKRLAESYKVVLENLQFSKTSQRVAENDLGFADLGWLMFDIFAQTKSRHELAIGAPINGGDDGVIFFLRQKPPGSDVLTPESH
jgi:hypothetical protein